MAKSEFVRQMRQAYPMYVSPISDYKSTVQILKNRSLLFEDKKEVDDSFKYSTESLRRAIDIELEAAGLMSHETISGEDQEKARVKAVANLKKDPLHYYHIIAGESSKVDKHDQPKETKRGKLEKDTFNDMKKATLKEIKQNLVEGTRALVGFLSGDRLTTTYNHYDGYPSNLGKGLETHYNDDDKAKDVAMKGYITYLNPETGEIESTHNEAPGKLVLPDDPEQRAREIAEEIDKFGADFGYVWDDNTNQWITIKNTGTRSMIDQIMDKIAMVNVHSGETMEGVDEVDSSLDPYEDKKEIIRQVIELIKGSIPTNNETIKDFIRTHYNDIINLGDDQAILDEFQEFLSVNTDYVDETNAYDSDDDTQDMIDQMRKDGKDSDDFVDEKKVQELKDVEDGRDIGGKIIEFADGGNVDINIDYQRGKTKDFKDVPVEKAIDIVNQYIDQNDLTQASTDETNRILQVDDGDTAIDITKAGMSEKKGNDHDGEILAYIADTYIQNAKDGDRAFAAFLDLNIRDAVQDVVGILQDPKHPLHVDTKIEYGIVEKDKARGIFEKKGKDHDGDGDVDGDDYMAAKDKAIKKAMGKDEIVKENIKAIISKVLEEGTINEAATQELAKMTDTYGGFEGMKAVLLQLQDVVTDIESYYDKTRGKIQKAFDSMGDVRNEEGLKVGGFLAPAVESAFNKDLRPVTKKGFTKGLDQPQVRVISQRDIDRHNSGEAPLGEAEPVKDTVYTPPVNGTLRETKK